MKLKGICLDNALLAIANYLVRLENYINAIFKVAS